MTAAPVIVALGASYEGKVTVGIVAVILQVPLTEIGADVGADVGADIAAESLEIFTEVAEDRGVEEVSGVESALGVRELGLVAKLEVLFRLVRVVGKDVKALLPVPANDECTLLNPVPGNDTCMLLTPVPVNHVCILLTPVPGSAVCRLLTPVPRERVLVGSPVLFSNLGTPPVPNAAVSGRVETEASKLSRCCTTGEASC